MALSAMLKIGHECAADVQIKKVYDVSQPRPVHQIAQRAAECAAQGKAEQGGQGRPGAQGVNDDGEGGQGGRQAQGGRPEAHVMEEAEGAPGVLGIGQREEAGDDITAVDVAVVGPAPVGARDPVLGRLIRRQDQPGQAVEPPARQYPPSSCSTVVSA